MKTFSYKRLLPALMFAVLLLAPAVRTLAQEARQAGSESTPAAQSSEANKAEEDENDVYRKSPMVRKMGAAVGMNPDQASTAFQWVNFGILAVLLGWFLLKALPKAFRNRNTVIQKHLVDARTATEEASARLGNVEARLAKLDSEIAAMKAQADTDSAADEQRIKATVEDEKKKILEAADQEIAAATTQAHRQLQRYAAELAIEQAGRKLAINAETDRLLIQSFARRLGGENKEGQN